MGRYKDVHLAKLAEACARFVEDPAGFGFDVMQDQIIEAMDLMADDGLVELAEAIGGRQ